MFSVSVCIATYNGEMFIEEQLVSILSQIDVRDEVIIVDDASTDRTLKLVENLADDRVKIVALEENIGHTKAFERAISFASKDIIFLSDQDDIWFPGKYQRVLEEFSTKESPILVVHSLSLINSVGKEIYVNVVCVTVHFTFRIGPPIVRI